MASQSKVRAQIRHQRRRGRSVNIPKEDVASSSIFRDAPVAFVFNDRKKVYPLPEKYWGSA